MKPKPFFLSISLHFSGRALLDLMQRCDDIPPSPGKRVLCRHPFDEAKRAYVCPSHVETLYHVYWKNGKVHRKPWTLQIAFVAIVAFQLDTKGPCKRSQHCWPTRRNIVGPNMLRAFARALKVIGCTSKSFPQEAKTMTPNPTWKKEKKRQTLAQMWKNTERKTSWRWSTFTCI